MTRKETIARIHVLIERGRKRDLTGATTLLNILAQEGEDFIIDPNGILTTITVLRARVADAFLHLKEK